MAQRLNEQIAEALRFDYTEEDWIQIEKSVRHLRPSQAGLEDLHTRLRVHIRTYLFAELNRPGHVIRNKRITKHWDQIVKLSDDALKSLSAVERLESDGPPPRLAPEKYCEHKNALMKLNVSARGRLAAPRIDDGTPKASPRGWFQFEVLEIWTNLGGQLRISRHPRTKKITGPLARYFAAVTEPVPGYQGSLESLPDILHRQKAFEKWKAELGLEAVEIDREMLMDETPIEP